MSKMKQIFLLMISALFASSMKAVTVADMPSDAPTLASKMMMGWNLGNTLEVASGETGWGNPKTTQAMIDAVYEAGFNAVRIPIVWYPYITYRDGVVTINPDRLARIKEVVGYCLKHKMYVIINTHHELWMESHATYADSAEVYKKERALWQAIAKAFADYDEHLLFAGTNEVHIKGLWTECTAENAKVQNGFNQIFVDAVRATGGRNLYRNLVVQSYACNDVWGIKHLTVPKDQVSGRLMIEFHCYDPWEYGGKDEDKYWGTPYKKYGISSWGQEDYFKSLFATIQKQFVDKGIPAIMGECGAGRNAVGANQKIADASRAYYFEFVMSQAKRHGIVPFLWDNGNIGNGADTFGLFDRHNGMKQVDRFSIPAIMKGAKTRYPYAK